MAEAEISNLGGCGALARAAAKARVPCTRLSRMRRFLASVQRPTMDSPARWMITSKPETDSGARGLAGSHPTRPLADAPRTRRTTSYPFDCKAGTRAAPMRPDDPLTRILAGMKLTNPLYINLGEDCRKEDRLAVAQHGPRIALLELLLSFRAKLCIPASPSSRIVGQRFIRDLAQRLINPSTRGFI